MVTFQQTQVPVAPPEPSPEQARGEIVKILGDSTHAYFDVRSPAHDDAIRDVTHLHEQAYPEPTPPGKASPEAPATDPAALPLPVGPAPEGKEWNREFLESAKRDADDLGVPASEAAEIVQYCVSRDPAACPDTETALAMLQEQWGNRTDFNILASQLVARRLDPVSFEALNEGLGDDPGLIRRFAAKGQALALAWEKLQAIYQNPMHPYHLKFRGTPAHEQAIQEVQRLVETVHGKRRLG